MYASSLGITRNTNHQIPSGKMTAGTSVKGFPVEQDVCALFESQSVKTAKTMGKKLLMELRGKKCHEMFV